MRPLTIVLAVALFLVFSSCGKMKETPSSSTQKMRSAVTDNTGKGDYEKKEADESMTPGNEEGGLDKDNKTTTSTTTPVKLSRKIIKTGQISLEVKDLKTTEKALNDLIIKNAGYIATSNLNEGYLTITARIPVDRFDAFVEKTDGMGKVTYKTIQAEDVTDQYFDLDAHIKTRKILLEQYQAHLRRANTIDEMLKIEREINNLIREIEQLEGSFRQLDNQVEYSTVTFTISLPRSQQISESYPSFVEGLKKLGYDIIWFSYRVLMMIIYLAVFGTILFAVFGGLYVLTFGKIGIIRKIFSKKKPVNS